MTYEDVPFKSIPRYYWDEKAGIKNNTVRVIDDSDPRFQNLRQQIVNKITNKVPYGKIKIQHTEKKKEFFLRWIQHLALWNELIIITWATEVLT